MPDPRTAHPSTPKPSGTIRKLVFAAALLGIGGTEHRLLIDGVTAATTVPRNPQLDLSASPAISHNTILATEGQTITIAVRASDPADTSGYNSFAVDVNPKNLPPGSTWTPRQATGTYTWTPAPGDAQKYPSFILNFTANNTFLGGSTTHPITVMFANGAAPQFDAALPDRQTVVVGQRLKLAIGANSPLKKAKITARRLPPGATLGATRKNTSTGLWTATLSWKPKPGQNGKTFSTQFVAKTTGGGARLQSSHTIAFKAATTPDSGTPLAVTQAQWDASTAKLSASGTGPSGQAITLMFANSSTPVTSVSILVDDNGNWQYTSAMGLEDPATSVPCAIQAWVNGVNSDPFTVQGAPASCVNGTPSCDSGKWYPETTTMTGMCM